MDPITGINQMASARSLSEFHHLHMPSRCSLCRLRFLARRLPSATSHNLRPDISGSWTAWMDGWKVPVKMRLCTHFSVVWGSGWRPAPNGAGLLPAHYPLKPRHALSFHVSRTRLFGIACLPYRAVLIMAKSSLADAFNFCSTLMPRRLFPRLRHQTDIRTPRRNVFRLVSAPRSVRTFL
ncbi:hypothetical protein CPB85DRAFT_196619 [Mucidula mucida]|nr:hypothetical protein CPB85DRAFT_196619 [Mucidula mucida]